MSDKKQPLIRIEDVLAALMILPSIWVTSPSEYYSLFNGNIVVSKHTTALILLFIFAILTALYENRIQRIIDSIKSGVKIPAVTMEDQTVFLWKTKFRILYVIRDYLPFLICILAYHRLQAILPHWEVINLDNAFRWLDLHIIEGFRAALISWGSNSPRFNDVIGLSYKSYFLSVPIIATYLYLIKDTKKFRQLFLAIVTGSIFALIVQTVSLPAIYTSVALFYSLKISRILMYWYMPIAILCFLADILTSSNYFAAVVIGVIIGVVSIPIAKRLEERF
ncbi:MAG: hypothetical protein V1647_05105 [Pseudomonadota bacterium]